MMKMRQLVVATAVLAALAATLYWSNHRKPANDSVNASPSTANAKIISLNQDDISKLEVHKKDGDDVVLNRFGPSSWKITSPKPLVADAESVSTILYNLSPLDGATLIEDKAADLKQFGLAEPEAQVSATGKDGKTQTILVGDETPTGDAAYVMVSGDSKVYSVPKNTKTNLDKGLKDLRDKRLMPVDFDKLASVEISGAKLHLTFGSDDGQWTVHSPANLRGDTSKMETIIEKLRTATMDPSASDAEMKKAASLFASGTPIATLKATDASGSQELQIHKAADGYYAKTTAMDGVYKVPNELGDAVNKDAEDFREKRVFDFAEADPDKVELHDGSKGYFLTRSGEDWWSDGKKMDPLSVQEFLRSIRTLTATKFAPNGFSSPALSLVVTSKDGKRVEKVDISKGGSGYLAKRADGTALFELDAKAVEDVRKAVEGLKPAEAPPSKK
ncbi:MAG TPA: DUF4340 domain-containing protein [Candidatus Acidoferrales bacterium]|nr:DUF4340 domain-containing protein [Candidatus Acidoferrales bacterium]